MKSRVLQEEGTALTNTQGTRGYKQNEQMGKDGGPSGGWQQEGLFALRLQGLEAGDGAR